VPDLPLAEANSNDIIFLMHHNKILKDKNIRYFVIAAVAVFAFVVLGSVLKQGYFTKVTVDKDAQQVPQEIAAVVDATSGTFSSSDGKYYITDESGSRTEVIADGDLTRLVGASTLQEFVGKKVQAVVSKNSKTGMSEVVSLEFVR